MCGTPTVEYRENRLFLAENKNILVYECVCKCIEEGWIL